LSALAKLMNRIGRIGRKTPKGTAAFLAATPIRSPSSDLRHPKMVEPDGIEPTTSCLQSTRSPN
jgi:hypothetical protein